MLDLHDLWFISFNIDRPDSRIDGHLHKIHVNLQGQGAAMVLMETRDRV